MPRGRPHTARRARQVVLHNPKVEREEPKRFTFDSVYATPRPALPAAQRVPKTTAATPPRASLVLGSRVGVRRPFTIPYYLTASYVIFWVRYALSSRIVPRCRRPGTTGRASRVACSQRPRSPSWTQSSPALMVRRDRTTNQAGQATGTIGPGRLDRSLACTCGRHHFRIWADGHGQDVHDGGCSGRRRRA